MPLWKTTLHAPRWVESSDTVLTDPEVEAVIIAMLAGTHFEPARLALLAGKHVFVENL